MVGKNVLGFSDKYKRPIVAVDVAVFTIENSELKIMVAKREREPHKNKLALIGAFVKIDEKCEDAVKRALQKKAGVADIYVEQLYTFDKIDRDTRDRVITISYYALVKIEDLVITNQNAHLMRIADVADLAFDHSDILKYALMRLKWKLEYTTVAFTLLPELFTIWELRQIYEIILDKKLDRSNFRRKIFSLGILQKTDKIAQDSSRKPASYYIYSGKIGEIIKFF